MGRVKALRGAGSLEKRSGVPRRSLGTAALRTRPPTGCALAPGQCLPLPSPLLSLGLSRHLGCREPMAGCTAPHTFPSSVSACASEVERPPSLLCWASQRVALLTCQEKG